MPNTSCSIGTLVRCFVCTPAYVQQQPLHNYCYRDITQHVNSCRLGPGGRCQLMRVPLVQLGVPSPKKPWRAEAQRFAHTMGKRKRLGRPPLDLSCLLRSGSGPHGTTPDWRGWYEGRQVHFLGPLVARCEDTTRDKWAPWGEGDVSWRACIHGTVVLVLRGGLQPCRICLVKAYLLCDCGRFARLNMCGTSNVAACGGNHGAAVSSL